VPLEDLLEANGRYTEGFSLGHLTSRALKGVAILTCMDTRLDPLAILGLSPGDAKILRNAGARVTPDVLRSLALATHFLGVSEIAVMQHTGCALAGRSDEDVERDLAERGATQQGAVTAWLAMPSPDEALVADVELLRSSPLVAPGTRVEGWRYDVETGGIERIVLG
jgi:carbonic anhydrase